MTNRELTKNELAQREQIFRKDLGATDIFDAFDAEPATPRRESPLPASPLDAFAPEVFIHQSRSAVPLRSKSRVHPVALTCLAIVTAVFAFVLVERSTERVSPPIPPEEPSAVISEADQATPPSVSADIPPAVVDVAPAPSSPAPVPEIAETPPRPVLPVAPRSDSPRARPSAPSISRLPPSTARLAPPLSQTPPASPPRPLSQVAPAEAPVPPPPSRPATDVPAATSPAPAASTPTSIDEPELSPAPAPPTVAAVLPAPAAAASASAAAIDANTSRIENTLARYRKAFSALDAGAAHAVWPTVDQRTLGRAFERLERQEVLFDRCQIVDVNDARAEATCRGTASYVPRVGNRTPRVDHRQWRFNLVKVRDEWLIGAVEAR